MNEQARQQVREAMRAWNARQRPEWRRERARKAAAAMHAQGKTNTTAATAASLARFSTAEERRAHFAELARRSWAARRSRPGGGMNDKAVTQISPMELPEQRIERLAALLMTCPDFHGNYTQAQVIAKWVLGEARRLGWTVEIA